MSYTYASKTGSLKEFLEKVKTKDLGVPDKVTTDYLESIGYKSKNDRPIIRVLKLIKFIDETGVPTAHFTDFRTEKSGKVMANALREAYADLFRLYANPLQKSREDLENFFAKSEPSLKKDTLGLFVDTFKTLCEFADFGAVIQKKAEGEKIIEKEETATKKDQIAPQIPEGLAINLNIQITLPVTDNAEVYDKIFEALKKHIFSRS
jgi:hypothetical protein